jgi:hypothetical protein
MQFELLQQAAGALGPVVLEYVIKRIQPLPGFQDFQAKRLSIFSVVH